MGTDLRWHNAAAERNKGPITVELQRLLPARGPAAESCLWHRQHAAHCAAAMPTWRWQPTDADLRRRNPAWGLRHLDQVLELARGVGLELHQRLAMPSNNLLLALKRQV